MQKKGTNNINDVIYKGMKFKGLLRLKFIRLLYSGLGIMCGTDPWGLVYQSPSARSVGAREAHFIGEYHLKMKW